MRVGPPLHSIEKGVRSRKLDNCLSNSEAASVERSSISPPTTTFSDRAATHLLRSITTLEYFSSMRVLPSNRSNNRPDSMSISQEASSRLSSSILSGEIQGGITTGDNSGVSHCFFLKRQQPCSKFPSWNSYVPSVPAEAEETREQF